MKNRIGIIGGGQLGRMLGIAAKQMGFHVTVTDPTPKSPASHVVDEQIIGGYSDAEATKKLAQVSDFLTVEIEHIDTSTLQSLADRGVRVNPAPKTVEMIKNKYEQKQFLKKHKIPTADYRAIDTSEDILKAGKDWGFPLVLKAKRDAFDGRGNATIKTKLDIPRAFTSLSSRTKSPSSLAVSTRHPELVSGSLYIERFVPFIRELAVIAARDTRGNIVYYPVVETIHQNNICHIVKAPAEISPALQKKSIALATQVMKRLEGAGVFAIEMFLTQDKQILVNEIAPRVHNSGHFTIEGSVTSQFEQHIRAITGLPLGKTDMRVKAAVMINILGDRKGAVDVRKLEKALELPDVHVHIYGKSETKPERKMGHITATGKTMKDAYNKAVKARKILSI
ncbi:5-(carboxyamino)imidazole ribonucleotide synthase [Candidatus Microgenomates bacterium]|nr:5-(carboxyamino)imidazole ribonucleotide synthase [Candidatus Microgenomates bacterium]